MKDFSPPKRIPFHCVRVVLGGLCFALSLLVIVPTPTSALWKLTILVTEWGYWLIPVALLPLWPGWRRSWCGRIGALLGLCAVPLFLSPLILAIPITHQTPVDLKNTFGDTEPNSILHAPARPAPLVLTVGHQYLRPFAYAKICIYVNRPLTSAAYPSITPQGQ